jgi:hypothetical protein
MLKCPAMQVRSPNSKGAETQGARSGCLTAALAVTERCSIRWLPRLIAPRLSAHRIQGRSELCRSGKHGGQKPDTAFHRTKRTSLRRQTSAQSIQFRSEDTFSANSLSAPRKLSWGRSFGQDHDPTRIAERLASPQAKIDAQPKPASCTRKLRLHRAGRRAEDLGSALGGMIQMPSFFTTPSSELRTRNPSLSP